MSTTNSCKKVYKGTRGYTNQMHHLLKKLAEAAFDPAENLIYPLTRQTKSQPVALVVGPAQRNLDYVESIQCLLRRFVLLAFCPFGDEENLKSQYLYDLIADILATFHKSWSSFLFLVGGNSVNKSIGPKVGALPIFYWLRPHQF